MLVRRITALGACPRTGKGACIRGVEQSMLVGRTAALVPTFTSRCSSMLVGRIAALFHSDARCSA